MYDPEDTCDTIGYMVAELRIPEGNTTILLTCKNPQKSGGTQLYLNRTVDGNPLFVAGNG